MNVEKAMRELELRGFRVSRFADAAQAADYVCSQIHGRTVGIGGSRTVEALGLYDRLAEDNTVYWHWKEPGRATQEKALLAEVYICSANAVSETGEIVNIDGNCNRVASIMFGHKKVYLVVGCNKVQPDYDAALYYARNVAAPKNAQRLKKKTPCAVNADRCYDCKSPERICRGLSVLWTKPGAEECEVVLIGEELGY